MKVPALPAFRSTWSPRRLGVVFTLCASVALAACDSDNTPNENPDAAGGSGGRGGSGGSAANDGGAGSGGGTTGTAGATGNAGATGTGGTAAPFVDTDVVVARFNDDGTVDTDFGTLGIQRINLSDGARVGSSDVRDAPWGLAKDEQNRLIVFAARKSPGAGRVDTDRVVARLTANGALDTTFGDLTPDTMDAATLRTGIHAFGIGTLSDSARHGIVDPDGKIVSSGYTNQPTFVGTQTANSIVLARLHGGPAAASTAAAAAGASGAGGAGGAAGTTGSAGAAGGGGAAGAAGAGGAAGAAGTTGSAGASGSGGGAGGAAAPAPGTLDNSFGAMGIVNYNPFRSTDPLVQWGMAEAYGVTRQSTGAYVTAGYGRLAPSGQVNVVSFRWTATGQFDTTWGTNGIFERDLTSDNDRGRNIVTLPNDRILIVGSATPAPMNVDAMVMILTANGALDTTFNTTGYKTYKFDTVERPDEALFGAAVSPNKMFAAAAGYRSANTAMTSTNDDAALVILPLGSTGTEFAAAVPLSMTAADRFWAVTFDDDNKIVAAGYVTEGSDRWMAVARFNTDGTPDTSFGMNGIAKINAATAGTLEEARGVVVQSDGKIVIMGSAEVTP